MKRIINTRPIVFIALSLAFGVVMGFLSFIQNACIFITLIALALLIYLAITSYDKDKGKFILICICAVAFTLGLLLITLKINTFTLARGFDGDTCQLTAIVTGVDRLSNDNLGLTLNSVKIGAKKVSFDVYLVVPNQTVNVGDKIVTDAKLTYQGLEAKNLASFTPLFGYSEMVTTTLENASAFHKLFNLVKTKILSNLKGDNGAMALALLLGDTSYLSTDTKLAYKLSGISHIFSVSGLHVVFFSMLVASLLKLVKVKGIYHVILSFVITLCYAGVCGFPIPAIRAVIMTLVLNTSKAFGRKNDNLNSIFLSLIVILLIFPHTLLSYGLILSYLAVIGMSVYNFCFEKPLDGYPKFIKNALSTSIAVTILITPVLFKMSGYMSIIVVLLNVIVVPAVNVLYYVLCFTTIVTLIIPALDFLWFLPDAITNFINAFMSVVDFSRLVFYGTVSTMALVLYYFALTFTFDQVNLKKPIKISCGVMSALIICCSLWGLF